MRPLSQQDHYEVLELDRDATPEEVERAYRLGQATYAEDSMATYSLLGKDESQALRERLELAYEVLSDATARERYDARLDGAEDEGEPARQSLLLPLEPEDREEPPPVRRRAEAIPQIEGFEDVDDGQGGSYDGARLRRARLLRGIEVDQIATITKINPTYLYFIEEERFEALPASVYVRGFVAAYARCLGLDPESVASSYMERIQERRGERESGRGRGRD